MVIIQADDKYRLKQANISFYLLKIRIRVLRGMCEKIKKRNPGPISYQQHKESSIGPILIFHAIVAASPGTQPFQGCVRCPELTRGRRFAPTPGWRPQPLRGTGVWLSCRNTHRGIFTLQNFNVVAHMAVS